VRKERRLRVFENKVLRGIFGPKRDEVTGRCRRLFNQELNDLYSSPNIIRVNTSTRMKWLRSTYGEEERLIRRFGEETWGKSHLEERDIHGMIILKWILRM
jgi:hypothetical protein